MPQQQSNLSTAEPNDNGSMFLISGLLEHTATSVIRTPLTRFALAPGIHSESDVNRGSVI